MAKKVAILQSNYIPWKGYFDIIGMVDEFIFYDEVQYTKNDWRNRNKIKTSSGLKWLTIPCQVKGRLTNSLKINEVRIVDSGWSRRHFEVISQCYRGAEFYRKYIDVIEDIYKCSAAEELLCDVNYKFIISINDILGIKTKISYSSDYSLVEGQTERLVDLCQQAGATEYISGPAAKDYIRADMFENAGIKLTWMDYSGYPEYPQLFTPFEHGVTILDMLFNLGKQTVDFMKFSK